MALAQPAGGPGPGESVDLPLAETPRLAPTGETGQAIVGAARTFLDTLTDAQREAVLFDFDDNTQRAHWSNLPDSLHPRAGG